MQAPALWRCLHACGLAPVLRRLQRWRLCCCGLQLDCMLGDQSLYTRADEVEASWKFISRIHDEWKRSFARGIPTYEAGTWGPDESDAMLKRSGHAWRRL